MRKRGFRWVFQLVFLVAVFSCQHDGLTDDLGAVAPGDGAKAELDNFILQYIKDTGEPFDWNTAPDEVIFEAIRLTDGMLVAGFGNGVTRDGAVRDQILRTVYASENKVAAELGALDEVLKYIDDQLGFLIVKVERPETVSNVRALPGVTFTEANGYPISLETIRAFTGIVRPASRSAAPVRPDRRDMVLDPYQTDPDYPDQVAAYDAGAGKTMRRHNIDDVYRTYEIYGERIGLAVIDNGIVDWGQELMLTNGYGQKDFRGYYNPLWFLPWTQPDGIEPQPSDAFGLSEFIDAQWEHGTYMVGGAFIHAPNSNLTSVRATTAVIILAPSQILAVSNAVRALADDPDNRIASLSAGSFFIYHRIRNAMLYYDSRGKIMVCAAGTFFEELTEFMNVIFPANLPYTVAATGIKNRESTGGEFVAGDVSITGRKNDFCVENSSSSSGATCQTASMLALLWSADPSMSRQEVMDIMITSSYYYHELGEKHPEFGWGTVDMLEAVGRVLD